MTGPGRLSQREKEVTALLLDGKSNKQIAATLNLTVRGVEFHLTRIYSKLGVTCRTEAALKLASQGLQESTVERTVVPLRDSTVEKEAMPGENGKKLFSRSLLMLKKPYAIGAGLLVVIIVALIALLSPRYDFHFDGGTGQAAMESAAKNLDGIEMRIANSDPVEAGKIVLNQYLRAFRQAETHYTIRLTSYEIAQLDYLGKENSQLTYAARVKVTPQDSALFTQAVNDIFACENTPDGIYISIRFVVFQNLDQYKLVVVEPLEAE